MENQALSLGRIFEISTQWCVTEMEKAMKFFFSMAALVATVSLIAFLSGGTSANTPVSTMGYKSRPTPQPKFQGSIENVNRTEILAYARSLDFDEDYHESDVRRLVTKTTDGWSVGPLAHIASERGMTLLDTNTMSGGRIIAKIKSDGYLPRLNLTPGDNYVWIDRAADRSMRAVIIPGESDGQLKQFKWSCLHKFDTKGWPASARWRWHEGYGDTIWARCIEGCCEVQDEEFKAAAVEPCCK
jgi:hypothetical protein